jgi:hypothetical protein
MAMPAKPHVAGHGEVRELIAAAPLATPRYELVDGDLPDYWIVDLDTRALRALSTMRLPGGRPSRILVFGR